MDLKCGYCGGTNIVLQEVGPHSKAVCADCGKFVKFVKKTQAAAIKSLDKTNLYDSKKLDEINFKLDIILDYIGNGGKL